MYEDFSDKVLDNLEDIKWIIVSFCDDTISYKLLSNFEDKLVVYSLSDKQTNLEEFESLDGRIKDLNKDYEYIIIEDKIAIGLPEYLKVFEEIEKLGIENYKFNDDFSIDVNGYVYLNSERLTKIPIKFRNVSGDFDCGYNNLTSLEGCPKTIGGNFTCSFNNLTSLKGSPETVGSNFNCNVNKLTSLLGSPKTVGGYFNCRFNNLTSLEGCPETVVRDFNCNNNKLRSLEGCPKMVGGNFYCYDNNLTSLVGSPKTIGGNFNCSSNKLTSFDGIGDVKGEIFSDL